MKVRRGDIVTVELNSTKGSEQQESNRPSVVIQNDVGNQYSPTTIVAPFTKQYDPTDIYPFEVEILASNTTLNHDSVADLSQIRGVDMSNRSDEEYRVSAGNPNGEDRCCDQKQPRSVNYYLS